MYLDKKTVSQVKNYQIILTCIKKDIRTLSTFYSVPNCFMNDRVEFKIDRTILTCLEYDQSYPLQRDVLT